MSEQTIINVVNIGPFISELNEQITFAIGATHIYISHGDLRKLERNARMAPMDYKFFEFKKYYRGLEVIVSGSMSYPEFPIILGIIPKKEKYK